MRCILRMFVVLAIASPAWATQQSATSSVPFQKPTVSTPVPNIHSPGVPAVTTPSSSSVYQNSASAPTATAPASPADYGRSGIYADHEALRVLRCSAAARHNFRRLGVEHDVYPLLLLSHADSLRVVPEDDTGVHLLSGERQPDLRHYESDLLHSRPA